MTQARKKGIITHSINFNLYSPWITLQLYTLSSIWTDKGTKAHPYKCIVYTNTLYSVLTSTGVYKIP